MTTSGTQAFTLNTEQICSFALKLLQVTASGQIANSDDMASVLDTLNMMIDSWRGKYKLILQSDWISVPLTASSVVNDGGVDYECIRNHTADSANMPTSDSGISYWKPLATTTGAPWVYSTEYTAICNPVLDANIVGIGRGFVRTKTGNNPQDTFLETKLTTADYFWLGNKANAGKPLQAYFRRRETNSLFLYPSPPDTETYQVNIEVYRRLDDFVNAEDTPSFQAEWTQALVYNLAVAAHPLFETKGIAQLSKLEALAKEALDRAASLDEESGDIIFVPRSGYGRKYY